MSPDRGPSEASEKEDKSQRGDTEMDGEKVIVCERTATAVKGKTKGTKDSEPERTKAEETMFKYRKGL